MTPSEAERDAVRAGRGAPATARTEGAGEAWRAGLAALGRAVAAEASVSRVVLGTAVAGAVVVLAVMHRVALDAGSESLMGADRAWLLVAALATAAMWCVGTVTQLGSMPVRPPVGRLFAVQVAASFANQLLPAGSGGIAINVRFLRRCGLTRGAAMGSVGVNSLAGLVTHLLLLAVAVAGVPSALGMLGERHWPRPREVAAAVAGSPWVEAGLGVVAVAVAVALVLLRPARFARVARTRAVAGWAHLRRELAGLGAVLRHPGRAVALWLGSVLSPLLHGLVLFAVLRSLAVPITVPTVVVVYLVVSSVSALVPSPGGIGGLDVVLVAGLAGAGVPSAAALGAVVGYRLITVWLPLLPGACVFAVLLRRRII
ncbi:lysylphosphatidylglycerol synthase transmembrane domain-containing protein [Actinomadura opuntiae]|uniref:lysylphosphatidylglycerol synthase transmembrane domain-containing protein n=1 Tax=Actinomadura sp. OS1-43 TaxID=604315 RepID=UPI00255ABC93|nr:lysylphosphatidylglycerol synthase transmembrane domain-containing protein [Actinomadura sp. OS1-43]MDL4816241.1 lysylphosphatidylglycerol synthase transmembrane domain-containing protein [Actinomadura sp. OS1-43]